GMTCWRRLRDWQDEGWIHYDSSVSPTRPGSNASNVGGWRQQYQATATANGTSGTPNSPMNQAVGPVSAVMRLKNAWMMPLCVACMIVEGQSAAACAVVLPCAIIRHPFVGRLHVPHHRCYSRCMFHASCWPGHRSERHRPNRCSDPNCGK